MLEVLLVSMTFSAPETPPMSLPVVPVVTCFKTGEQEAGMNKICYYDCLGSPAAITIRATQLCPLSIQS